MMELLGFGVTHRKCEMKKSPEMPRESKTGFAIAICACVEVLNPPPTGLADLQEVEVDGGVARRGLPVPDAELLQRIELLCAEQGPGGVEQLRLVGEEGELVDGGRLGGSVKEEGCGTTRYCHGMGQQVQR